MLAYGSVTAAATELSDTKSHKKHAENAKIQ